ncbi:MAG: Ig-like domain-containing protein [Vicinamibacterales bacterium]
MNKNLVIASTLAAAFGLSLFGPTVGESRAQSTARVTLTAPSAGAIFVTGARVTLTAAATSSDRYKISAIDFYVDGEFIGRDSQAPYAQTWTTTEPGAHVLYALGRTRGGSTHFESQDVRVTVTSSTTTTTTTTNPSIDGDAVTGTTAPPTISLTSPSSSTTLTAPASLVLQASATAATGRTISRVEFYVGSALVATDTTNPYSTSWTLSTGTHVLTAKAVDSTGATATSAGVTLNVTGAAVPTVALTFPTSGSTLAAPASLSLQANATATTGRTITRVEFFSGSTLLGADESNPYVFPWTAAAGAHVLTAKATDSAGGTATSAAVSLNVASTSLPTITLTSPLSGSTFAAPATVQLAATVSNPPAGAVVEFLNGTTVIGSDASAPYAFSWANVTAGSYSVTARLAATSAAVSAPAAVVVGSSTPVPAGNLAALPLVYASGLVYQGAFRVPNTQLGNSSFGYAWKGFAFNPARNSLFMGGHDYEQQIAEIGIPGASTASSLSSLAVAPALQGFGDPTDGARSLVGGAGDATKIGGLLVYNGELFSSAYIYYDAGGLQQVSHFRNGVDLTNRTDARGPFKVGSSIAGLVSGYMGLIPQAWQATLGGPALTGQCCLSIISRTSYGPSAFAFDPATLGLQATVSAAPLVYYDANHPTLGPWSGSSPLYGGSTEIGGVVFPEGTRSVLFFGINGQGTFCYGDGSSQNPPPSGACYDPTTSDKGGHAYPYVYQVWAYDALDLAAVKAGSKQPWDVVPYAYWTLNLPYTPRGMPRIQGAAYDPATQRIWLSVVKADGDVPVVHQLSVVLP